MLQCGQGVEANVRTQNTIAIAIHFHYSFTLIEIGEGDCGLCVCLYVCVSGCGRRLWKLHMKKKCDVLIVRVLLLLSLIV